MSAYCVAKIEIHDPSHYAKYSEGFMEILERYKGRVLSVDENPTVLEGSWSSTRTVILEFENKKSALTWYQSVEYQRLAQSRFDSSTGDVVVIKGIDKG